MADINQRVLCIGERVGVTWDGSTWPATLIRRHPSGSYDVRFDVSSVQSPPLLSPHSPHMVAREALPLCASLRNKVWSIPVQNCPTWMEADAFRRKSGGGDGRGAVLQAVS